MLNILIALAVFGFMIADMVSLWLRVRRIQKHDAFISRICDFSPHSEQFNTDF